MKYYHFYDGLIICCEFWHAVNMYYWINRENLKLPPEMMLIVVKIVGQSKENQLKQYYRLVHVKEEPEMIEIEGSTTENAIFLPKKSFI